MSIMFGPFTYLTWLFLFIALPLLFLSGWRAAFWQQRRALAWALLGSLVGGWLWDAVSVRLGIWSYAPAHIVGLWLLGLPIEEWLWIVGVTLLFAALTIRLVERGRSA